MVSEDRKLFVRRRPTPYADENKISARSCLGQAGKVVFVVRIGMHEANLKAVGFQLLLGESWQSVFSLILIFTDHHQDRSPVVLEPKRLAAEEVDARD